MVITPEMVSYQCCGISVVPIWVAGTTTAMTHKCEPEEKDITTTWKWGKPPEDK